MKNTALHISPIGGVKREGHWEVPAGSLSVTLIGGINLDLTEAELTAPVTTFTKVSLIGGVSIRIPAGYTVEVSGFSLNGGIGHRTVRRSDDPDAKVIRIRHFALLGGVNIS